MRLVLEAVPGDRPEVVAVRAGAPEARLALARRLVGVALLELGPGVAQLVRPGRPRRRAPPPPRPSASATSSDPGAEREPPPRALVRRTARRSAKAQSAATTPASDRHEHQRRGGVRQQAVEAGRGVLVVDVEQRLPDRQQRERDEDRPERDAQPVGRDHEQDEQRERQGEHPAAALAEQRQAGEQRGRRPAPLPRRAGCARADAPRWRRSRTARAVHIATFALM